MQLRVSFREQHDSGESTFGMSTSLRARHSTPVQEVVALGVNAVRQFRQEVTSGSRPERSFLRGRVETPEMDALLQELESTEGLEEPTVRIHRPHYISQGLWPIRELLGFESQDVLSRVQIKPTPAEECIHMHEQSDRLVMLTKGSGMLNVAPGRPEMFPRNLTRFELHAGDVVFLSRGLGHLFFAGPDSAEALVWHCPYVAHGDPSYQSLMRATSLMKLAPLKDVLFDPLLLSVVYSVHHGCTKTTALCQQLHADRQTIEAALRGLEATKMLTLNDATHWNLHPTLRIEETDGRIHLIRDEDGVTAKVSAKLRT